MRLVKVLYRRRPYPIRSYIRSYKGGRINVSSMTSCIYICLDSPLEDEVIKHGLFLEDFRILSDKLDSKLIHIDNLKVMQWS